MGDQRIWEFDIESFKERKKRLTRPKRTKIPPTIAQRLTTKRPKGLTYLLIFIAIGAKSYVIVIIGNCTSCEVLEL